ncbi:sodium-dependent transporter [Thermococcus sp.]|uniref:sodium-dependent transporter n=1 Tax=Thermococcus sp. TaxID=35749 RepID=UPI0026153F8C|nr:sodium-dependent transporter [Thermococcus sp.]
MDEIKKWTLYLIFLVAGFATGIGSIGLFPQFWLQYGMTGMAVHLVFLAVFTYVAILEAETVMKSGYYFVELYTKVARKPGMILSILTVVAMFLSYYAANTMLSILSPVLGTGTVARLIAKVIMFALAFLILTRAREKTFTIMAVGSVFFVLAVLVTTIAFKTQIPENAAFLGMAKHMLVATHGITLEMIKAAAERALYGIGLGFGFYLMLGSFLNERFNAKLIIGTGIFIQLLIGVLSTITIVYAIAPTTPERLLTYVYGGSEGAIALLGELPEILSNYQILLVLIGLSTFFAGITSLLPTAEVGLQIIESMLGVGRTRAATYLIGISLLIGILDSPPSVADMIVRAVVIATFFTAIFELYPVATSKNRLSTPSMVIVGIAVLLFLVGGLYAFFGVFRAGGIYVVSGILAAAIVLFGLLGDSLVSQETP